jgi:hypothetical protein
MESWQVTKAKCRALSVSSAMGATALPVIRHRSYAPRSACYPDLRRLVAIQCD